MNVSLGGLGDVPVPADYNGDGRADVAVYQPGTSPTSAQAYWRWCPTATTAQSTTCTGNEVVTQWGTREDVPQPGLDFDGALPHELAAYRPRLGRYYWRAASGGVTNWKAIGGEGAVPLAGQYDADFKTDLAVYEPYTATFKLLRSTDNYTTTISRSFGTKYIPQASGTAQDRSGAVALGGVYQIQWICSPTCWPNLKRAASLWFPYDGTWKTFWDPVNSSAVQTCQWGYGAGDAPVPNVDYNNDGTADMVVHRADTYDGPSWLYFKNAIPGGACTGAEQGIYSNWARRVVADLSGSVEEWLNICSEQYGQGCWELGGAAFGNSPTGAVACDSGGVPSARATAPYRGFRCCADPVAAR